MLEKIFGKKRTEELVDKISEKVSKNIESDIKDYVKELKKNGNSPKKVIEALDNRKKELEIAALYRDINNKAKHHKINRTNNNPWIKNKWYEYTALFRVKVDEHDVKNILLNHKEASSPQALQGKWQAYGQMRAARTLARGSIFATGVIGSITYLYVQSQNKKTIKLKENEAKLKENQAKFKENETKFNESQSEVFKALRTATIENKQLLYADKMIKELCNGDNNCLDSYNLQKGKAMQEAIKEMEDLQDKAEKPFKI